MVEIGDQKIEGKIKGTGSYTKFVAEKLKGDQAPVALVTNDYHMARATKIFESFSLQIVQVPVEGTIEKRSQYYKNLIEKYSKSNDLKKKRLVEIGLRGVMKIDPSGKWITEIAHRLRK